MEQLTRTHLASHSPTIVTFALAGLLLLNPVPGRSEPATSSPLLTAQTTTGANANGRLEQVFEEFLSQQVQRTITPREEDLFKEFEAWRRSQALAVEPGERSGPGGGQRQRGIWRAAEGTNIREAPSARSKVIGEVPKGGLLRVIGTSADGKWLEIDRGDRPPGYYWVARATRVR